jgi:hypothetical protein
MKASKNPLIAFVAVIGICAIIYSIWHMYERESLRARERAMFAAPAAPGVPDVIHASPGPPPPQP